MLRSLVGSEMCIRDRHTHAPGHLFRTSESACNIVQSFLGREPHLRPGRTPAMQDVGTQVKASVCAKAAAKQLCLVCLLYTSDAADDLLCVDLGGRRIIKKKKKQHKSHYYYQSN